MLVANTFRFSPSLLLFPGYRFTLPVRLTEGRISTTIYLMKFIGVHASLSGYCGFPP